MVKPLANVLSALKNEDGQYSWETVSILQYWACLADKGQWDGDAVDVAKETAEAFQETHNEQINEILELPEFAALIAPEDEADAVDDRSAWQIVAV